MRASTHVYTQYCSYLFKFNGQISQVPDFSLRFNENLMPNALKLPRMEGSGKGPTILVYCTQPYPDFSSNTGWSLS